MDFHKIILGKLHLYWIKEIGFLIHLIKPSIFAVDFLFFYYNQMLTKSDACLSIVSWYLLCILHFAFVELNSDTYSATILLFVFTCAYFLVVYFGFWYQTNKVLYVHVSICFIYFKTVKPKTGKSQRLTKCKWTTEDITLQSL